MIADNNPTPVIRKDALAGQPDDKRPCQGPGCHDAYQELLGATVMMVDDEPTTIEILQAFLEDAGYNRFITTSDSSCAMDLLDEDRPDVVLLDVNMPRVSGFDILQAMRNKDELKHIPVLVLTSADDPETKLHALNLGATDFLAKPVDPSELALRLRNTLAAKAYQDRLTYYDTLTNLPNRKMFMERMNWELKKAQRYHKTGAVLHVDLDRFKRINDTLGHSVGDALLKSVAARLEKSVRDADSVGRFNTDNSSISLSRLGGDEFTILLPETAKAEDARIVAQRILKSFEQPLKIDGNDLFITASIGIAVFPQDGAEPGVLLKNAEVAMYHCKQQGRNTHEFYSGEMNARSLERLNLEQQLRTALERDELTLYYQPKVSADSRQLVGAEALLRWEHPDLGFIPPDQFISIAEESGLIVPIGEWILYTACRQARTWHEMGLGALKIAVNVSGRQFTSPELMSAISGALEKSGLDPTYLTLELTENMLMENADENITTLNAIKAMGVKLSIDDFGTGYSSLSYLKQFPLDELKVDQSFVAEIQADTDQAPIASAIIAMARSLNLKVVAEGVETEHQFEFVRDRGCNEIQGYLFSKPLSCDGLVALAQDWKRAAS